MDILPTMASVKVSQDYVDIASWVMSIIMASLYVYTHTYRVPALHQCIPYIYVKYAQIMCTYCRHTCNIHMYVCTVCAHLQYVLTFSMCSLYVPLTVGEHLQYVNNFSMSTL